jgi:hypothetical protein
MEKAMLKLDKESSDGLSIFDVTSSVIETKMCHRDISTYFDD